MWKCVHRGLRTSANLLKNDQSNGGCIVSSIINKDIDELSPQRNDQSKFAYGGEGFKRERKIHNDQRLLAQDYKRPSNAPCSQMGDTVAVSTKSLPFSFPNSEPKTRTTNVDQIGIVCGCGKASNDNLLYCRNCYQVYEEDRKCFCFSKIRNRSWLSRKFGARSHSDNSSTSVTRTESLNHLSPKPLSGEQQPVCFELSEDKSLPNGFSPTQKFDSSTKSCEAPTQTSSYLQPYHSIYERRPDVELGHASPPKQSHLCQLFSYSLLKLPFLSHNLMRNKGFNSFSACWLNKSKTQFGRDDNSGQGSESKGESEEANNDHWSRFQTQQSLLEAIGLSSALLLGWFLAQCRIWRLCEGRSSEDSRKRKKRCIGGMLVRLLYPGRNNSFQISNPPPSHHHESSGALEREEKGPSTNGNRIVLVPCNSGSEGYFSSGLNKLNELQEESYSDNLTLYFPKNETSSEVTVNHRSEEVHPVNEPNGKTVIPLPWYGQESKQYGPITFEDAVNEAGKSLEEAQAEVQLILALEKLEDEENDIGPSAAELLDSAARLGNTVAAFNLGICYEMGVGGVTKDLTKAYYWYKIASDNGHAAATYNMAVFHGQGLAGLCVNTQLAHQLLERASSLGLPEASDALTLFTSVKPTEHTDGLEKKQYQECYRCNSQSSSQSSLAYDKGTEASVRSNDSYLINNHSDTSESRHNSSLHRKLEDAHSTFTHVMESFNLPFSKLNEDEGLCAEILLDNTLSVKKSDCDYTSEIFFAQ